MVQPRLAARMGRIQPFYVMELLARAKALEAQGRSVIHMEVGEPDFATPQPIVDAGHRALAEGRTHYTPALGIDALRRAIASHYLERFGVDLDPARIAVTPGASGALQLVLSILVNPGEGVLMAAELAVVVVGGLFSSTLLTLLVIPVIYSLLKGRRQTSAGQ